jgi:hypothetical protein
MQLGRIIHVYSHWAKLCTYCGSWQLWATDGRLIVCSACHDGTRRPPSWHPKPPPEAPENQSSQSGF